MQAFHDTRQKEFRDPFGAVTVSSSVTLALDIWDGDASAVYLRTWFEDVGESCIPMHVEPKAGCAHYVATIKPSGLGNLWYCFIIETNDGSRLYYGARDGAVGGVGQLWDVMPPSFQITVFRVRETYPQWYRAGIVYQIFPDRFRRGAGWLTQAQAALATPRRGVDRRLMEDWDAPLGYTRDDKGNVTCWDFYGGTLEGIREALPQLAEWGITALYLNPIFEATSNHRYDTGDYLSIDPVLGTEEDFRRLVSEGRALGIDLILDGVFNHTGDDSRYFNRFGNYDTVGAWQSSDSPYRSWYLLNDDGSYQSWWGVTDLPATDKSSDAWQSFVFGSGGVVEYWSLAGARGWRLDVADELTDSFIAGIKAAQNRVNPEGLLLGEVWEDASNKVSYGAMRHYLNGNELDSVMNYPFRLSLLEFLTGRESAQDLAECLMSLKENYPAPALYETLNLLGSHDRVRLLTVLGDAPNPDELSEEERAAFRLSDGALGLAKGRFWLAMLTQMIMAGVPCIYYGDEAGMQGYSDPYNRGTYPWGHEDSDTKTMTQNAIALRQRFDFLVDGGYEPQAFHEEVFGIWRWRVDISEANPLTDPLLFGNRELGAYNEASESLCLLINRSRSQTVPMTVKNPGTDLIVDELISGRGLTVTDDTVTFPLYPMDSALLYFHEPSSMAKPLLPGTGVFCAVTSLPNPQGGLGTLGSTAQQFVDCLAQAAQRYWQVLPLTPPDSFGSPYAGLSAFAGSPALIGHKDSFEALYESFLSCGYVQLDAEGLFSVPSAESPNVRYGADDFEIFFAQEAYWLGPYGVFRALKDRFGDDVLWQRWPKEAKELGKVLVDAIQSSETFSFEDLKTIAPAEAPKAHYHAFIQWLFQIQWQNLHDRAQWQSIALIGDIPIYVSEDSADTWSHPDLFVLDEDGYARECAGTPPDRFAINGQLWGNPTYDWQTLADDGYRWWIERFKRVIDLYDYVRLDHFLGFEHYYSIPRGRLGSEGRWLKGPGLNLFTAAYQALGSLPFIAEDLGTVTPAARALVAQCGFSGMDVMVFSDSDLRAGYNPTPGKLVYSTTHDTDTLVGWLSEHYFTADDQADPTEDMPENPASRLALQLLKNAYEFEDLVVIVPLQDLLGLGSDARMNVPGQAEGNWRWQATSDQMASLGQRIAQLRC